MIDLPPPSVVIDTGTFTEHRYQGPEGSRRYRLFVPGPLADRRPLLVMLHGCTQDAADFARGTGMNTAAAAAGVIVLYPEQPAEANPLKCWNWFLPAHQQRGGGEPAIIAGMTRAVIAEQRVDPDRVYLAGMSAGGAMAVLAGLGYPDLFAAIGVHSGLPYRAAGGVGEARAAMAGGGPDPTIQARAAWTAMGAEARALPAMLVQGLADPSVAPANLTRLFDQLVALHDLAAGPGGRGLERPGERSEQPTGRYTVRREVLRDGRGKRVLESWAVDGLAHAWSGGSAEGTWTDPAAPPVTAELLRFLLEQSRRP